MAHELDFTKGYAAIAYAGETPWHGFGFQMEAGQTLDEWLIRAGMDYNVLRRPIGVATNRVIDEDGTVTPDTPGVHSVRSWTPIKKKVALHRSDTNGQLGIVSDNYKIVQPKDVMFFFKSLIEKLGFEMHTAGVLAGGNRVWALAKVGKDFTINGDKVEGYLLLATSYDGKFSTTVQFTSIRVVCNNTLTWSLNQGETQGKGIIRVPHFTEFDADSVKNELGLGRVDAGWSAFKDNVIKLSEVTVTKRQAVEFFLEVLGVTEEDAAVKGKQLINVKKLVAFYESGPGSSFVTAKNTTWGLVNAVSYFTDHARRARDNSTRFDSATFGDGARMKSEAFVKALNIANAA